jgi:hypothetical protein
MNGQKTAATVPTKIAGSKPTVVLTPLDLLIARELRRPRLGGETSTTVASKVLDKMLQDMERQTSPDELIKGIATDEDARQAWRRSPALREEFDSPGILWAYVDADRKGLVQIVRR